MFLRSTWNGWKDKFKRKTKTKWEYFNQLPQLPNNCTAQALTLWLCTNCNLQYGCRTMCCVPHNFINIQKYSRNRITKKMHCSARKIHSDVQRRLQLFCVHCVPFTEWIYQSTSGFLSFSTLRFRNDLRCESKCVVFVIIFNWHTSAATALITRRFIRILRR